MYGLVDNNNSIPNLLLLSSSIQKNEGLRLKPYTDSTGNISIGYGRDLTAKGISNAEATALFSADLQSAITEAQGEPWWPHVAANDARARALIEMVFNMGLGGIRSFVNATKYLCCDDFNGAADAFLDSQWSSQVGNRAQILTQMIRTGEDPT